MRFLLRPSTHAFRGLLDCALLSQCFPCLVERIAGSLSYISIEHIGNTAVAAGLSSKPIIDILIILQSMTEAKHWIKPLETLAYVFSKENSDISHWILSKGMPPFGEKRSHHIHIVESSNNAR